MKPTTVFHHLAESGSSTPQPRSRLLNAVAGCVLSAGLLFCPTAALAQTAPTRDSVAPDVVARFKSFTEKPPVIERIVFRISRNVHLPIEVNQGNEIYVARYQDNAYLIQQIASLEEFPVGPDHPTAYRPLLSCLGRYENYYWNVTGNHFHETTDTQGTKDGESNPVRHANKALCDATLDSILNFGINNVSIGSIKWHDNAFEKMSDSEKPVLIKGSLTLSHSAPSQLRLNYGPYRWLVVYDYSIPMTPGFLPSGWTTYTMDEEGKPVFFSEVQILSCQIGNRRNKDRSVFLPKNVPFLDQVKCKSIYTNGEEFLATTNGLVKPAVGLPLPGFTPPNQ